MTLIDSVLTRAIGQQKLFNKFGGKFKKFAMWGGFMCVANCYIFLSPTWRTENEFFCKFFCKAAAYNLTHAASCMC